LRKSVNHWLLPVKEARVTIAVERREADRLTAMRGSGESYSNVILRLVEIEATPQTPPYRRSVQGGRAGSLASAIRFP
jgi:hypothetical protein